MIEKAIAPAEGFEYYQNTIYWNNFDAIQNRTNFLISGDNSIDWIGHVLRKYGSFDKAFMLSCGNGWVERQLFRNRTIKSVIGTDINAELLRQARAAASEINMPAVYAEADVNTCNFKDFSADLVVNFAAMHHVAAINRTTQAMSELLTPGGTYIGFDYVGAHRNQYDSVT